MIRSSSEMWITLELRGFSVSGGRLWCDWNTSFSLSSTFDCRCEWPQTAVPTNLANNHFQRSNLFNWINFKHTFVPITRWKSAYAALEPHSFLVHGAHTCSVLIVLDPLVLCALRGAKRPYCVSGAFASRMYGCACAARTPAPGLPYTVNAIIIHAKPHIQQHLHLFHLLNRKRA